MIMKRTILVIALLCGWVNAHGAASWVQYDTSTKLVILPTNLFLANTSALTAALTAAGWSPGGGGGSGNASTNATQAWAAGYTNTAGGRWVFNGDLLAGSTNLVQKLGSIELALTGYQPLDPDLTALATLNGAGLTNLSASTAFSTGTVPIARLATGTPTGSKFIRDDGTLAIPPGGGGTGDVVGPASSTDGRIALFDGVTGKLLKVGTLNEAVLALLNAANVFTGTNMFQGPTTFATLIITNIDLLNPIPNRGVSNATPSRFAVFGSDNRLTNDIAETGTGAPVRSVSPALTGSPTVPTASVGASNSLAASTEYVDRAVASVPSGSTGSGTSTNDRIFSWTADRMMPGTNATTQAQYRVLGDGIPAMEFDGSTAEEISAVGVWGASIGSTSYAVLTFASDDTANTVCWQVQLQSLALRGLDTNLWTTAALWTSNVPGTARVATNIVIPISSSPFSGGGTNDYGKPYMLRVSRVPSSDSSLSNAFLISVDHRFTP